MSLNSYNDLNAIQLDVLREIGNIGSGNAATALSSMLFKPVQIEVPKINILDFDEVTAALGGPENMMMGLLVMFQGDVQGMMMFLLETDFAHMTLNTLMGTDLKDFSEIDDMSISAMLEVSNILSASYINAIANMSGLRIDIDPPSICVDMVGSILSVPLIHFAHVSDKIIFIENQFTSEEDSAQSHVLMIPEMDSLSTILTNLGIEI